MPGAVAPLVPPVPMDQRPMREQVLWCCLYGGGVIGMLVIYGVLQERIMTIPYEGPEGAVIFEHSVFLIFLNRVAAVIFSLFMAIQHKEQLENTAPLWKYLVVSLANVFASSCQYEALKYVSFAVQMLGKSFKMMPVMIWGMLINNKSYTWQDWLIAAAVTGGVTEFLMTGPTNPNNSQGNSVKGILLLVLFLAFDGLTSAMQEKLFKEHQTSKFNQMFYINSLSSFVSLSTLLTTGQLLPSFSFFFSHARFAVDAVTLSASAVGGQFFIYSQVQAFGALVYAATMNVRQVVSIIVSYVTYQHHITPFQVMGLTLVFAALLYKSFVGAKDGKKIEQEPLKLAAENNGYKATVGAAV